ncbi:MAG: 2-amino-4-hydroxy-6-hydroxymethyldihydropteridine diphosphokinase [Mangrovibacterium sp.]
MNTCIIGIGSNLNPEKNIREAINLLGREGKLVAVSSLVHTDPLGITDQPAFINGAVKMKTTMEKEIFRKYLKKLEDRLGRDRSQPKFGPRCIDLDIVVWNGQVVDEDYYTRGFLRDAAAELGFVT